MTQLEAVDALKRCLDNTAPISRFQDLGLFYFAKRFFPEQFQLPFGLVHYKVSNMFFGMYDPQYTSRMERQGYAMVSRGMAKTTLGTFLAPLFNIYFKGHSSQWRIYNPGWEGGDGVNTNRIIEFTVGEDFMLITSETSSSAENFVMNIKNIVDDRVDLVPWFGDKHPDMLQIEMQDTQRRGELIWRKNAFITSDRTIVYGIGSGQQVRGRNVLNRRPTLFIVDDMYSENNTKTEESRRKLDKWFYAAAKNSVDVQKGKVILLGTMVHQDTIFRDIKKSDQWKGVEVPLLESDELEKALSLCEKKGVYLVIPSKERCNELQKQFKTLAWREQYSLYTILSMYKESYERGREADFYQEFLNVIRKSDEKSISRKTFVETPMMLENRRGQIILKVEIDGRIWETLMECYIGVDLASSQKAKSDDTVVTIAGIGKFTSPVAGTAMIETRVLPYIYDIDGGKWGIFSMSKEESPNGKEIKGWVNHIEDVDSKGLPIKMVSVEIAGQTETIFNEAYRWFSTRGKTIPLNPETVSNQMKKEERILSILMPVAQKYRRILVNKDVIKKDKFYDQLEWLGSDGMHDDYPDSAAYAFLYAKEPIGKILEAPKSKIDQRHKGYRVNSWETM